MSTKTLRKRIALVAVSALGAGLLSVASVPSANAAISGMNVYPNQTNGAIYVVSATEANNKSQGLVVDPTSGDNVGIQQFAAMYSNGVIVVGTGAASTAQKISLSGGTLNGADKVAKLTGAAGTISVAADLSSVSLSAGAGNQLFAAVKPSAAGTPLVISIYNNSGDVVPSAIVNVTVVAAGSAGSLSLGNSNIKLDNGSSTTPNNVDVPTSSTAANLDCVYLYYDLRDGLKLPMSASTSVIAKGPAGTTVGLYNSVGTYSLAAGTYAGASWVWVCQDVANINKPVSGTLTLTVNGVDVATRSINIVGIAAKLVVTEDAIAIRNAAYNDVAYGTAYAASASYAPSHSFVATDAAGNKVPTTGVTIDTTGLDAQVIGFGNIQDADPFSVSPYLRSGGITFSCADTSGSTKLKAKVLLSNAVTLTSDAFTVTCAGGAKNYTATTDAQTYKTGDVMTVTVKGTDKSGKPANDYGLINGSGGATIASGASAANVVAPTAADTFYGGTAKYKYIIGQTPGAYTVAVNFPDLNSATYSQSAVLLPITVNPAVAGVSNADVLKAIVSLIASINKQIAALQKALLKKK
jgi:hypothetical protein